MLTPPKPDGPLRQGDIIRDVPFVVFPKAFQVKVNGERGQVRLDSQQPASCKKVQELGTAKHLAASAIPLVVTPGMVVTQGCDIDFKDHITLARVFPIDRILQDAKDALALDEPIVLHEVIRTITEGHSALNLVYLGPLDGLGRCVADLMRVQSYPQDWKKCFRETRWMSLTDEGVKYVQGRLSALTGRFALDSGFWHSAADADIAERLVHDPGALNRALADFRAKKENAKRP